MSLSDLDAGQLRSQRVPPHGIFGVKSDRGAHRGEPYWSLTIAVMLLALATLLAMVPVFTTTSWFLASAGAIVVGGVASALFRGWGAAPAVVTLLAAAVVLGYFTLVFGAGTGLLFILPTPETLGVFGALNAEGQFSIQTQATPADPTPGIVFLVAVGAAVLLLVLDALAVGLRLPALAGAPVAVLALVPSLFLRLDEQVWVLVLAAAAYLLLLRLDVRTRRGEEQRTTERAGGYARGGPRIVGTSKQPSVGPLGGAIGVGSLAIVSALVVTAAVPVVALGAQLGVGPPSTSLFGGAVNPLVDLGQDLRRVAPVPALSYSSTSKRAVYLKMLTLDSFAGDSWVAGHSAFNETNTMNAFAAPPGLSDTVARSSIRTEVEVANVQSEWLPVPYPASSIEGLDGQWYWDSDALTVATTHSSIAGQSYVVNGIEIAPTQEDLAATVKEYPGEIARYLELPGETPASISDTARAVVAGADSAYLQAVALQKFLRGRDFTYSEETPVQNGFDGGGLQAISAFLEQRSGYCIHFASAMAVMARTLDIPSRVSLGYAPGERSRQTLGGETRYDVKTSDLHAWPELYFAGIGWVPFEPTPGRGAVPSYSVPLAAATTPGAESPATEAGTQPGDAAAQQVDELGRPITPSAVQAAQDATLRNAWLIAVVLLVLLFAPLIVRSTQRVLRRRGARRSGGVLLLWNELSDTLTDYGHPVHDTQTPRARSEVIAKVLTDSGCKPDSEPLKALQSLLVAVEREHYARPAERHSSQSHPPVKPGASIKLVREQAVVSRALRAASPWRQRLRAIFVPASLFDRIRGALSPAAVHNI